MKKLNYFRLVIFLLVILLASLYELGKDYEKYQRKRIDAYPKEELVQVKE